MPNSPNRKIVSPAELLARVRDARAAGRTLVQCHGCFDIVHPGHVRYLQFARQLGDILVVSLTGDAGMAKGPDRPYIPEELRAENLAALEFVDWVVIDGHPTACELLELLRPDVYVKGREYAVSSDPRFRREAEIVEQGGGRVVFHSGDVVFSSTRLIQGLEKDSQLDELRLRTLCARGGINMPAAEAVLEQFRDRSVLVVGEIFRERSVICDVGETAVDAPIQTLHRLDERTNWGGAAAVAIQLAALGARPILVSPIGEDAAADLLPSDLAALGVDLRPVGVPGSTAEQTTFVADDAKLLRVCTGATRPLDRAAERAILARAADAARLSSLVLLSDHGYGFLQKSITAPIIECVRAASGLVAAHAPAPRSELADQRDLDLVILGERRLRGLLHDMSASLSVVAWRLLNGTHSRSAIVSLHKRGLVSFDGHDVAGDALPERLRSEFVPALAARPVDLVGCEDAIVATAALARASGGSLALATYLAAAADAIAASRVGRIPVRMADLAAWIALRPELRAESRFLPDSITAGDIARLAPPLAPSEIRH